MKLENNKNIFCSISAGYSSVLMAIKIKEWYPDHNIIFGMANTSKERIESLKFMNECDEAFKLNMYWIQAVINPKKGKGTDFEIVKFNELKKEGEIFESGIRKYGIPCKINKWCNREMKLNPLRKFADSIFGRNNYSIAVGLRSDEMDRVRKDFFKNNVFYPLMDNKINTKYRNAFWNNQVIKLKIPAFKGNCDKCFEKSNRKLMTIISEEEQPLDWWHYMSEKYGKTELDCKPAYNSYASNGGINFYRQNLSLVDLVEMAKKPFKKATDEYLYESDLLDAEGDCGSGCVVF